MIDGDKLKGLKRIVLNYLHVIKGDKLKGLNRIGLKLATYD